MDNHKGQSQFTQGTRTYTSTRTTADGTKIYTLSATPATIINNTGGSYDDSALKQRVTTLESNTGGGATYDDTALVSRITTLENASTNSSNSGTILASASINKTYGLNSTTEVTHPTGCTAGNTGTNVAILNVPGATTSSKVIVSHVSRGAVQMSDWIEPTITKGSGSITLTWDGVTSASVFKCDVMVIA